MELEERPAGAPGETALGIVPISRAEVVIWANAIRDKAWSLHRRGEASFKDYATASALACKAMDAETAGKATSAEWIRITTFYRWLKERSLKNDKLGELCSEFLNRTGL